MSVEERLNNVVKTQGAVHLTLIDPDNQPPDTAGKMAAQAVQGGTDGIMVGGSTGAGGSILDKTIKAIKEQTDLPTILFPASAGGVSAYADAVFFMSLLNSRDVNYITTNQAMGAPMVKKYGIEPISMAYIIIEPGGTVGWVGDAKLIPRKKPAIAVAYALAGKYMGMHYIYLEAGSGADSPVPAAMVGAVKQSVGNETMVIVGGGIRTGETAAKLVKAGADMIVTGTIVEQVSDVKSKINELVSAIKQ
ncbi:MAG: geranylgeranylglyceryl/heptaprenylglyceryl phosphate synthase [Methanosarcinales archaeon]|nr:geranylgeranylglyceryl/heptaprenylglyceryl phosphate synthase [Methanosarcinales archaeon]